MIFLTRRWEGAYLGIAGTASKKRVLPDLPVSRELVEANIKVEAPPSEVLRLPWMQHIFSCTMLDHKIQYAACTLLYGRQSNVYRHEP